MDLSVNIIRWLNTGLSVLGLCSLDLSWGVLCDGLCTLTPVWDLETYMMRTSLLEGACVCVCGVGGNLQWWEHICGRGQVCVCVCSVGWGWRTYVMGTSLYSGPWGCPGVVGDCWIGFMVTVGIHLLTITCLFSILSPVITRKKMVLNSLPCNTNI